MFWRLFGSVSLLILCAIGLLGLLLVSRVQRHALGQIERGLRTKAILVREVISNQRPSQSPSLQQRIVALREEIATRITLLAEDGRVLADSEEEPEQMENHANRPEVQDARSAGMGSATRYSSTVHQPMMYLALRTRIDSSPVAYVRVSLPLDSVHEELAVLRRIIWTAALSTALAALGLTFWLVGRVVRPLTELTSGAERIAAGGYGHKVYRGGHDEIGKLARAFNHMSERLDAQFTQLAEDREQLRMILGGMVEGVVALDAEQHILFANERAEQLLGFQREARAGRKLWEVVRQRALHDLVQRALTGPEPCKEEVNWNGPTVKSLTVHAARLPGTPLRGAVLVLHDTSELRRLERVRQEFVANVSHELKTPLSVIKACVETLLEGAIEDEAHRGRFLERIADRADRLEALILDLLSLARIEAGTEIFAFTSVPLKPTVEAGLERHRARADAKKLTLEPVPPASLEPDDLNAWADEEAVNEILDNLVDNALKYTPEGGRIRVGWRAENDREVCLEVEDTGIGIPEQDLPRIFERFYRVDKARSRELGGTGLGLSIVKHLVQALHGSVHAASQTGQGTRFTVRLPRAPAE
jgi:two-component system phosphate regulon sensor histidine kinase PhoR